MNRQDLKDSIQRMQGSIALFESQLSKGCLSCSQFQHGTMCGHYNAPVPAEFQAKGCDQWFFDDIPF